MRCSGMVIIFNQEYYKNRKLSWCTYIQASFFEITNLSNKPEKPDRVFKFIFNMRISYT